VGSASSDSPSLTDVSGLGGFIMCCELGSRQRSRHPACPAGRAGRFIIIALDPRTTSPPSQPWRSDLGGPKLFFKKIFCFGCARCYATTGLRPVRNRPALRLVPTERQRITTDPPTHPEHTSVICYHHNATLCLFQQMCEVSNRPTHPSKMHMHACATQHFM
jgi:hypothetical protein